MMTRLRFLAYFVVFFCVQLGYGSVCAAIGTEDKQRLESYVAHRFHTSPNAGLRLSEQVTVNAQCYRKLIFTGSGPLGVFQLVLFASPDLRFLTSDMFDSTVDPRKEEEENARHLMGQLLEGEYASRGPSDASVTVVVFSDFQCPYCKKMSSMLAGEPLLASGGGVRLVFRHMPLHQHDWAMQAAEAAACVQFQNSAAFWSFHDKIFENQTRISKGSASAVISEIAEHTNGIDLAAFKTCLVRQLSFGVVIRDQTIGEHVGVTGTPTLFINGQQVLTPSDPAELHQKLESALAHASTRTDLTSGGSVSDLNAATQQ